MKYIPTIGLEIHAELKTASKMFCACANNPDEKTPNKNICPVCMSHPGTLPVINREAVHLVLMVGQALGAKLADYTEFDRKNYFYPDIPKGYQLSQYAYPLVSGGSLNGIELTRIHLEEDTARSQHQGDTSLVDYNRAGVPLMELVTEPVIHTAEDAGAFARELQTLLRTLGAGEANMEKGELRVEANISISPTEALGTKVEVKNLNSFRSVERAIAYEIKRQAAVLDAGGTVEQVTLGWDEAKQATYVQRKKEAAHDYRYFPDPDLPKLKLSEIKEFSSEALQKDLPELPWEKRARFVSLGAKKEYAEMFVQNGALAALFDAVSGERALAANYLGSDLAGLIAKEGEAGLAHITAAGFDAMLLAIAKGRLSSRGAKTALAEVYTKGGDLAEVIKKYEQQSDEGALKAIAQKVVDANPSVAQDFKAGKAAAMQFLVGQGMKESRGSANPEALRQALLALLS
jgi:aspartyl-tRNA(Asn)/glutamyl-tRNA(Gln) amidotransferase subunit B